jgi:hypothetical protein
MLSVEAHSDGAAGDVVGRSSFPPDFIAANIAEPPSPWLLEHASCVAMGPR